MLYLARAKEDNSFAFYDSELGPVPDEKVELTNEQYQNFLKANSLGARFTIKDGAPVALDYQDNVIDLSKMTPASSYAEPPSLASLAAVAFQKARQQFQDLQMMGQNFGPEMQKYMQALNAIIKGTDTTSTALPTAPSDLTS